MKLRRAETYRFGSQDVLLSVSFKKGDLENPLNFQYIMMVSPKRPLGESLAPMVLRGTGL